MTIFNRLEQWKEQGIVSPRQCDLLTGLARGEPFSLFLELNVLLYAGVLAFAGGLGWTSGLLFLCAYSLAAAALAPFAMAAACRNAVS